VIDAPRGDEPITFRVSPADLEITVTEPGVLESARKEDAYCNVEGGTTIIYIVPEGTQAKKGQLICELDSASLRDQLVNTQIGITSAEVDYQNAKTAREVAEIAVTEFIEGTYKRDLRSVKGEVAVAESAIRHAERRLERARRARGRLADSLAARKSAVSPSDILAELEVEDRLDSSEQTIAREKTALELAKSRQETLENYTKDKTIKTLALEVERKRPDELAKRATWELAKSKAKKLERQIAACQIIAPSDGIVVYANPPRQGANGRLSHIEEGAQVRERQKIFTLPDLARMQVATSVPEGQVGKIRHGMKAKIRVHAFPNQLFDATVVEVAPLPDPPPMMTNARNYTTKLKIDNPIPGLRPGMTTEVELIVANRENALSVPAQAVLNYGGKAHLAVRKPGGDFELREVNLGLSNDKLIEITQGVQSGDTVVLNPVEFISDEQRKRVAPSKPESQR
jgi:RND family efflux transporter MFP subunit